ncbi:MAG TPA: TolC family protein [Thermoanaerobaculia bacterium]|jgi:outer membrane protein TolC|nr:TolC family protein [Thermoanaerobaculia bacterium]
MSLTLAAALVTLSFQQVLSRVEQAHAIPNDAEAAAAALEVRPRLNIPTIRAETAASSAENVDVFTTNVFRFNAITALVSVDVPLSDGGLREKEWQIAKSDAESFRQRMRDRDDALFRETVDAVAALYVAQERLQVAHDALQRTIGLGDRAKEKLAVREISNVTAAQWNDEALAAEGQLLDLDLQRLDAETRVKQLMKDTSPEPLQVSLDPGVAQAFQPAPASTGAQAGKPAPHEVERTRLAFEEAEAAHRPQVTMSAFGGVALLGDSVGFASRTHYGLYGIRFSLSLPMFDAAATRRVAEARLQSEEAQIEQRITDEQKERERSALAAAASADEKRIEILRRAVDVAREREGSVVRLVSAGVRAENAAAEASAERAKRESDLLAARVELWKARQLLQRAP